MAHWFHRNPLKATSPVTFDLKGVITNGKAQSICRELREARAKLLSIVSNPNNEPAILIQAANTYASLLNGFITSHDPQNAGDSKLRRVINFRWTNTLCGNKVMEQKDALYEQICMLMNVALWYTKHASKMAGHEEPQMEEAKEVHKCMRTAAGIFSYIKDNLVSRLDEQSEAGVDTDVRVLTAYVKQCTAEAQEVTIARAIEMKHSSSIISSLGYETAKIFQEAEDSLTSLNETTVTKWRKYLQFKICIYNAYAYNYHGETLLAQDKCGEAIRCLQESQSYYKKALTAGHDYTTTKGPGTTAKPHEHLFFRKLGPVIDRVLDKCVRENGFIYHQKVPPEVSDLELKATYGLAAPEEMTVPDASPLWTAEAYAAFAMSANVGADAVDKSKKDESGPELPPVKEADIPQSTKDPHTFSGCVVS